MSDQDTIRPAIESDIECIVEMGKLSLSASPLRKFFTDDMRHAAQFCVELLKNPAALILIYERDGKPRGVLALMIADHFLCGIKTATELMWYVEPEFRPGGAGLFLLWEAEKQAKERGAQLLHFMADNERVGAVFERFGFHKLEVSYQKELSPCLS